MLSQEVRAVVDEVQELQDARAASDKAWQAMQDQIAQLQSQVGSAASLSQEDRDALGMAVSDMHALAQAFQHTVPANTDIGNQDAPATDPNANQATDPQASDPNPKLN